MREVAYCHDHDNALTDGLGRRLEPPCGCRLNQDGMVERPVMGRVSTQDLTEKLGDSLMWIDLRTKLVTLLHSQCDQGDQRAKDQLNFVVKHWPGGAAPRAAEFAVKVQTIANQRDLIERLVQDAGREITGTLLDEILVYLRNS
jgi:hypothetical protein